MSNVKLEWSTRNVLKERCFQNFHKISRKTSVSFIIKLQAEGIKANYHVHIVFATSIFFCKFCKIFSKNQFCRTSVNSCLSSQFCNEIEINPLLMSFSKTSIKVKMYQISAPLKQMSRKKSK